MDYNEFLNTVITLHKDHDPNEPAWLNVCLSDQPANGWWNEWIRWPRESHQVTKIIQENKGKYNIYMSAHLFSEQQALRINVLPSRTIQADLDNADIKSLPITPNVLVRTSDNRHQGFWVISEDVSIEQLELLSKRLTYSIANCDRSGWPLGHKMRLPGSMNFKYSSTGIAVEVISTTTKLVDVSQLELLPEPLGVSLERFDMEFLDHQDTPDIGPQELLNSIKTKLPATVVAQYNHPAQDRSATLWGLECAAFRAGLDRNQVFHLAKHSANNKFDTLRFHADRELAKDVLRAEQAVKANVVDCRAIIANARRLPGLVSERRQYMLSVVIKQLSEAGSFIKAPHGAVWYVRRDVGRPIHLSHRSTYLDALLDIQFGLNSTEVEHSYVVAGLLSHASTIDETGTVAALTHYDDQTNALYVHLGKKDVLKVTPDAITRISNGTDSIAFPWSPTLEPFNPTRTNTTNSNDGYSFSSNGKNNTHDLGEWHEELFGDCVRNIVNMPPDHAMILLRAWTLFVLFRSAATSRPLLAAFGQPGAGKSTLFRRIYALMYGRHRSLSSITTPDDFDQAVSTEALVLIDNVDTWERWLPDRLAISASTSDISKRKLYSDSDTVLVRRQAMIGLSAHNPKFGREDVADRLLLLTFERLTEFMPENIIIDRITTNRDQLWYSMLKDAQRVLANPMPTPDEVPQFRVGDFARIGYWIAQGLGESTKFKQAIQALQGGQRTFSLEEESLLTEALRTWATRKKHSDNDNDTWHSASQLWTELELLSRDPQTFARTYRNAMVLGKKLWSLQAILKEVFEVEWKMDPQSGTRVWRIRMKEQAGAPA